METTIKDVAKYAGVGVGTVSRVINNEKAVGEKTREKVLEAMKTLNYSRNNMAFRLRKNETRIIALLVPVINHPFFAKLARAGQEIYLKKLKLSLGVGEQVRLVDAEGFFALGEVKEFENGAAIKPIRQF